MDDTVDLWAEYLERLRQTQPASSSTTSSLNRGASSAKDQNVNVNGLKNEYHLTAGTSGVARWMVVSSSAMNMLMDCFSA